MRKVFYAGIILLIGLVYGGYHEQIDDNIFPQQELFEPTYQTVTVKDLANNPQTYHMEKVAVTGTAWENTATWKIIDNPYEVIIQGCQRPFNAEFVVNYKYRLKGIFDSGINTSRKPVLVCREPPLNIEKR